jgi:hypothetical protein
VGQFYPAVPPGLLELRRIQVLTQLECDANLALRMCPALTDSLQIISPLVFGFMILLGNSRPHLGRLFYSENGTVVHKLIYYARTVEFEVESCAR